ncbi:MAG: hypothetical protein AABM67_18140 [Acidobacteriota bacterium]
MSELHQNFALYEAMKRYVATAIDLVVRRGAQQVSQFQDDEDAVFFARLGMTNELQKLPEYQTCLETLLNDPIVTSQTEVLTGTNSGMRERSQSAEGLMTRVLDLGMREGQGDFDPVYFEYEYTRFEEAYYCSDIVYEVIAPLPGIAIARSLRLADDLEITTLPVEELDRTARKMKRRSSGHPFHDNVCIVRTECRLPKVVGDDHQPNPQAREQDQRTQRAAHDRIEQVVNALRLAGIESAYSSAIIHRPSKWAFDQDRFFRGRFQPDLFYVSSLEDQWLNGFEQFWQSFQSAADRKRSFLDVAIRRFGYAHERQRAEDRIIDLMISAEALFFSDYNKDNYIGEIRYRLSLRAALFLASEPESQRTIFRWMRDAYDLRSKLAHGGDVSSMKLPKRPDGTVVYIEEFVGAIQTYIRLALVKAIHLANDPVAPKNLVEWNELVFANKK